MRPVAARSPGVAATALAPCNPGKYLLCTARYLTYLLVPSTYLVRRIGGTHMSAASKLLLRYSYCVRRSPNKGKTCDHNARYLKIIRRVHQQLGPSPRHCLSPSPRVRGQHAGHQVPVTLPYLCHAQQVRYLRVLMLTHPGCVATASARPFNKHVAFLFP